MSKAKAPKAKQRQRHKALAAPKARVQKQRSSNGQKIPGGITGKGFLPGKSGNPGGRKRGAVNLTAQLRARLTQEDAVAIVASLIALAKAGDLQAAKLLLDRLDGPQSGPLALAMASASNANAQGAATFNVGVKPFELPDWHPSELTADELRALIQALEDGGAIKRQGGAVVVLPAKEPIDTGALETVARGLFGIPAGAAKGNGATEKPAPAPVPAAPLPLAAPPPAPAKTEPPDNGRPAGRSFSELEIFGTPEQRAEEQAERTAPRLHRTRPRNPLFG